MQCANHRHVGVGGVGHAKQGWKCHGTRGLQPITVVVVHREGAAFEAVAIPYPKSSKEKVEDFNELSKRGAGWSHGAGALVSRQTGCPAVFFGHESFAHASSDKFH